MKINEKSLGKYALSGAPPDREGHLYKRGNFNRGYQKRWCVLKGNLLFYYEKKSDKEPVGVVVLEGCTVELADHEDGFTFMLNFPGQNTRTYVMCADTQEDMEAWMKALSGASYDYMKVCVGELRKQLQDLESSASQALVQDAIRNTHSIHPSSIIDIPAPLCALDSGSSSSHSHGVTNRRRNPFDTQDSVERSFENDRQTVVEKQARTFLQMHQELRDQIVEITKEWLSSHPLSKATPVGTESAA